MKYGWTVSFLIDNMYGIHLYCLFQTFSGMSRSLITCLLGNNYFLVLEIYTKIVTKNSLVLRKSCNYDIPAQTSFTQVPKNFITSHFFSPQMEFTQNVSKTPFFQVNSLVHQASEGQNILTSPTKNTSSLGLSDTTFFTNCKSVFSWMLLYTYNFKVYKRGYIFLHPTVSRLNI